ncbi:hypothetical protein EYF80_018271 [Liparis tanakae]|uniref:Uncharacterized protein n=1 Tax=Liparis tanakae TaxID=230148 RepID=A0A4Z2I290_9TELE|nr:hypothetical protein EYF80_018271 [Liparis tanakae]
MARGKVMADCKALSQCGDKGSPADGRPFTLELHTVFRLETLLSCVQQKGDVHVFKKDDRGLRFWLGTPAID